MQYHVVLAPVTIIDAFVPVDTQAQIVKLLIAQRTVQTVNVKSQMNVLASLTGPVMSVRFQFAQTAQKLESVLDQTFALVKKVIPAQTVLLKLKPNQTTVW